MLQFKLIFIDKKHFNNKTMRCQCKIKLKTKSPAGLGELRYRIQEKKIFYIAILQFIGLFFLKDKTLHSPKTVNGSTNMMICLYNI